MMSITGLSCPHWIILLMPSRSVYWQEHCIAMHSDSSRHIVIHNAIYWHLKCLIVEKTNCACRSIFLHSKALKMNVMVLIIAVLKLGWTVREFNSISINFCRGVAAKWVKRSLVTLKTWVLFPTWIQYVKPSLVSSAVIIFSIFHVQTNMYRKVS